MMKIYLFIGLGLSVGFFSPQAYPKSVDKIMLYETEDPKKFTPKHLQDNAEVLLDRDSLLREENDELGIMKEYYYTRNDISRLSIAYHFSHDYEKLAKLQILDFQYTSKMNSYTDQWWGVQVKRVTGQYTAFADELTTSSGHADADANTTRGIDQQSMTIFGLGLGYRFKILEQFFKTNRVFEMIMVYANKVYHLDGATSLTYEGYGATMEYGVHKRISNSFFLGTKLGYNIASLSRPQKSDEDKLDRSLVFRWTSIGFEVGYYY